MARGQRPPAGPPCTGDRSVLTDPSPPHALPLPHAPSSPSTPPNPQKCRIFLPVRGSENCQPEDSLLLVECSKRHGTVLCVPDPQGRPRAPDPQTTRLRLCPQSCTTVRLADLRQGRGPGAGFREDFVGEDGGEHGLGTTTSRRERGRTQPLPTDRAPSSPGNGRPDPQGFDLDLNRALLRPATSASVVLTLPWGPPGIWGPGAPVRSFSLMWTPAEKPGGLSAGGGLRPPEVVNLRTGGKRALGQGTAGSGSAGAQGGAQGGGSRAGCSPGALME